MLGTNGWYRRNQVMLQEHHVDLVIVYDFSIQPGTPELDMINRARRHGIPVKIVDHDFISNRNDPDIDADPVGGHL